ncbi:sodium-dependent transporter bedraggled-like [Daphnia carinata]|uniref:sodium-dependent transporter bedraggled-like n=1 Tax=Daphnia carinata TaxID=120202 RepID=UPI00257E9E25|nr:sodium-dependent transporter bedraggled-like [Daphnia carinata]XP_059350874.1 sodium-dependent transporter bedraggled-like [Daphnia carinata]
MFSAMLGGGGGNRRATSLGKGHLSHAAAARLARTSSWNDGLDGAGNPSPSTNAGHPSILRVADESPQQQATTLQQLQQQQQARLRRTSMRRMVRFRMSASSTDVDPADAAQSGDAAVHDNGGNTSGTRTCNEPHPAANDGADASRNEGGIKSHNDSESHGNAGSNSSSSSSSGDERSPGSRRAAIPLLWQPASKQPQVEETTTRSPLPPPLLPPPPSSSSCQRSAAIPASFVSPLTAAPANESLTSGRRSACDGPTSTSTFHIESEGERDETDRWPRNTTDSPSSPPGATQSSGSSVNAGPLPGRAVLVRQVSRFSVMQTSPSLDGSSAPVGGVAGDSTATQSGGERDPCSPTGQLSSSSNQSRRQRGRSGRNREGGGHSRARRQRSNMSAASGTSRASTVSSPDIPIVRSQRRRNRNADGNVDPEEESRRKLGGIWPHNMAPMFALLAATLGLFNVSRFALLSIEYGGNFIVQFMLLSFLFGIPLLCFHACLGQFLGSNVIDMWRISPIFKGVGIALLIGQAVSGIYSIVGVAWMFFYFRDSFIAQEDRYKWSKCYEQIRSCSQPTNYSFSLEETIPDYFHARVLQRSAPWNPPLSFVSLKFELAFNLAVIWMIVFVALGKGLRSYGKVVYAFGTLPILGYFIICVKVLGYSSSIPTNGVGGVLDRTPWNEFFTDTKVWVIAAREVFMTWGMCGAIVMQITSHNRYSHSLRRDITVVIGLTLFVLMLSGFLASACLQIINARGPYEYVMSSFETDQSYKFLRNLRFMRQHQQSNLLNKQEEFHNNLVMGVAVREGDDGPGDHSGYHPIRLATELFPAVVAIIGPGEFSPFWAVLFYFSLVAFGIAQQLAIWHCVINGIVAFRSCCLKSWETTITFCTCLVGFFLCLPLATELGISIVYHLDYVMGSLWWLMIIYVVQIAAVLIVRGRPYNGESIVAVLVKGPGCMANWCVPMLTFSWSVVIPIGLLVLSVSSFKMGHFCDMFNWRMTEGYAYWPLWARQTGSMLQLIPILLIPAVGLIQCIRYLSSGPSDLFDRIKLLYRPHFRTYLIPNEPASRTASRSSRSQQRSERRRSGRSRSRSRSPSPGPTTFPDPPPKYTPPPTYNTATGARIAKMFRESIRRSFRQIRDMTTPVHTPGNTVTSMADMAELELGRGNREDHHQTSITSTSRHLPPAYTSVILEMRSHGPDDLRMPDILSDRLSQLVGCDSTEASTSGSSSACSSTTDCTGTSSSSSDTTSSAPMSAVELTRLLGESFRRSARNTLRNSLRFIRNGKTAAKPTANERSVTDDDDTTDTDQGGRHLVQGAVRIHRDPSLSNVVVTLPNAPGNHSESIA